MIATRHPLGLLAGLAVGLCLLATALVPALAQAKPSEEPFAIVPGSFHVTPLTDRAAAHADLTVSLEFAHQGLAGPTFNDNRNTIVELPPGFIGSNTAVPTCTVAQLVGSQAVGETGNPECPPASQVGTISFELTISSDAPEELTVPLYSMEVTSFGLAAQLGFNVFGTVVQVLNVSVRPGDSGLTVTTPNIERTGEFRRVSATVWGLPAAHVHDQERGRECAASFHPECPEPGGEEAKIPVRPFLANATGCQPHIAHLKANSWEHPQQFSEEATELAPLTECERVPFRPEIKTVPTTNSAETSTGLDASLEIPQSWDNPVSIATAHLKDISVTLPEGMSLNPSAGSGLGSCSEAQLAEETYDSPPSLGCPPESKVGSVVVETPLLAEHATGSLYVAEPFDNPFDSLLALYVVAKIPSRGVIVKVAGEVRPDPVTGQLTTLVLNAPEVPFDRFTLKFNQGPTSPLITPPACGTYTALADLTPWSAPLEPHHLSTVFPVETGVRGGPCPSGGVPPFHPLLHAGSYSNQAGAYSPFYIRLSREDGEQEITHFSIKLPPGLIGKLAGIPFCSDAALAQAKSREHDGGGAEEEGSPSCPAASEIGRTEVEAGVGTVLASAPGKIYLAGPYHGSAVSVAAVTNAKVGPFDLGTVVVRQALKVNPETGEVFVDSTGSDPLPHIVSGIPTHLRNIRVYMDRPEFVLNPTSCKRTSTASTVLGSGLDFANEGDDRPITASSFFQVANCAALGFKPKLALSLKGGTKRGATPAFKAVLNARKGDANIGEAQVTLPHSEFLEQAHIKTICTRAQFKEGNVPGEKCPAASIYGRARAVTPILDEPLEGPVFLRSSSHNLPDLVATLNSGQIDIALAGHIDSIEGGRIRNTFEAVPDAPVTKFTLEMQGGKKGLLVNSTNLCKTKHKAISHFVGQNGKVYDANPVLAAKCPKAKKKGAKSKKGKRPARAGR